MFDQMKAKIEAAREAGFGSEVSATVEGLLLDIAAAIGKPAGEVANFSAEMEAAVAKEVEAKLEAVAKVFSGAITELHERLDAVVNTLAVLSTPASPAPSEPPETEANVNPVPTPEELASAAAGNG